jgi:hypothetical protein
MYPNYIIPMKYVLTEIDDRIRVTISNDHKEIGLLYFEKAKKGFTNKPLSMGSWACVDAKIEDDSIFHEDFTPKQMVGECQDLIRQAGF